MQSLVRGMIRSPSGSPSRRGDTFARVSEPYSVLTDPRDRADPGRRRPLEAAPPDARHRRVRDQRVHRGRRRRPRRRGAHRGDARAPGGLRRDRGPRDVHARRRRARRAARHPRLHPRPVGAPARGRRRGRARPSSRSAASRACTRRRPGSGTSRPSATARAATTPRRSSCWPTAASGFPTRRGCSTRPPAGRRWPGTRTPRSRRSTAAFELEPKCVDWAKDDADLDAIRGLPGSPVVGLRAAEHAGRGSSLPGGSRAARWQIVS